MEDEEIEAEIRAETERLANDPVWRANLIRSLFSPGSPLMEESLARQILPPQPVED